MPTILQICVEGNTGSTGRIAEDIGVLAIERGWKSIIAFGRFPRKSKSDLIRIGSDLTVFIHFLQTRIFDNHCLGSKLATKRLIQKIREIKPDIIHLHHLHGYYINIEVLFSFLSGSSIPVVWTFHDCWSVTGHCAFFSEIGCEKWKTKCYECPQKMDYPSSLIFDRSEKNYYLKKRLFNSVQNMVLVPVSGWMDKIISDSFMKGIPTKLIYNGVDTNIFKPQDDDNSIREKYGVGNRFMLLSVANPWSRRKGFEDFITLAKVLRKDEVIVLVGLNDDQIRQLPSNIIGIRRTENRQELINLYSTADLYVNLSVEESFGLTTAEALSCGTPVVVYNTTASPEIADIKSGFIVEKHDIGALMKVIDSTKVIGKKSYSDSCRSRAVSFFDKKDRYKEYLDLYEIMMRSLHKEK
jgi:glycosyltransferase involved in cell wall biosynthesis